MAEVACGQDGRHTAPEPTDADTSCPCGLVTRIRSIETATQDPPTADDPGHG